MVEGSWTTGHTTSFEVESIGWTYTELISEVESSIMLPGLRLIDTSVTNLTYLVSSLLIDCSPGPKLIQDYGVWSFEVKENSGFVASWAKSYIGEDSWGEGILREIIDQRIVQLEEGVRVAYRESRVIDLQDIKLPKEGWVLPVPLIDYRS